jgi:hypothetical protein
VNQKEIDALVERIAELRAENRALSQDARRFRALAALIEVGGWQCIHSGLLIESGQELANELDKEKLYV